MGSIKLSEDYGIHTIELYLRNLKYTEVQKVIDRLVDYGEIWKIKSDPYNLDRQFKSQYFVGDGVRMRIYQSHNKSNGIGFAINPSTLLSGKYQPVELWVPTPEAVDELLEQLSEMLDKLGLDPSYAKKASLSEMDLTRNKWHEDGCDVTPYIRVFRKGFLPKGFEALVNKDKDLNPYLYIIQSERKKAKQSKSQKPSGVVVKVYDKIHELKEFNRCPESLEDSSLLRFEVSLKHKQILKKFDLDRKASLYEMLRAGYEQGDELIEGYLRKIFPFSGKVVQYQKAVALIEKRVRNDLLKEQMLYLLKKTSDSAGVSAAVRKLRNCYSDVDGRRVKKIYAKFDELGICPITLPKG